MPKNYLRIIFIRRRCLKRNAERERGGEGESWTFGMTNAAVRGARFNDNFLLRVLSLSLSSLGTDTSSGRRKCNCSSNSDDAGVIRIARANVLDSVCACISIHPRAQPPTLLQKQRRRLWTRMRGLDRIALGTDETARYRLQREREHEG